MRKSKKSPAAAPAPAPAPVVAPAPVAPPPAAKAPLPEAATVAPAESFKGRLQRPGDIDARLMLNTDILLIYVNLGVGVDVDVGVARLGPGVLSVGGEFEVGICFSACLALKGLTGWDFSNAFYSPHARVAYHFLPGDGRGLEKVDLYGLVLGGITYTTTRVSGVSSGADFDYQGSDVAPSVGLGAGAKKVAHFKHFLF